MKIVGSQSQVTAALVATSTLVSAGSAVVSINDAAFGNGQNGTTTNTINASALSAIGGKTTGTVTVDNAVKIVGSQSQVTGALVTANTLVATGTAVVY